MSIFSIQVKGEERGEYAVNLSAVENGTELTLEDLQDTRERISVDAESVVVKIGDHMIPLDELRSIIEARAASEGEVGRIVRALRERIYDARRKGERTVHCSFGLLLSWAAMLERTDSDLTAAKDRIEGYELASRGF